MFHLFTHAFFKACLFLGAGSLSHACHHSFDIKSEMGGLRTKMPVTFATFMIGSLALAGLFPFAGFWSKDEILVGTGGFPGTDANGSYTLFLIMGLIGAAMTAGLHDPGDLADLLRPVPRPCGTTRVPEGDDDPSRRARRPLGRHRFPQLPGRLVRWAGRALRPEVRAMGGARAEATPSTSSATATRICAGRDRQPSRHRFGSVRPGATTSSSRPRTRPQPSTPTGSHPAAVSPGPVTCSSSRSTSWTILYTDIIVGGIKGPIARMAYWINQNVIDVVVELRRQLIDGSRSFRVPLHRSGSDRRCGEPVGNQCLGVRSGAPQGADRSHSPVRKPHVRCRHVAGGRVHLGGLGREI